MSWIERMLEERLAQAAAAGELDAPHLAGKPIPDLDRQRSQGWWAEQFVQRELSHDRRKAAIAETGKARVAFWRATSIGELRELVRAANAAIVAANINLIPTDQVELIDWPDVAERWRALHRQPPDAMRSST